MTKSRRKSSLTRWVAITLSIAGFLAWIRFPEIRKPLSGGTFHLFSRSEGSAPVSDRVVVVELDGSGPSGDGGRTWQVWDLARLLEFIAQSNPEILGVNLDLEKNYSQRDKGILSEALAGLPVVLDGGFVPGPVSSLYPFSLPAALEDSLFSADPADKAVAQFPLVKGGGQAAYPWGEGVTLAYSPPPFSGGEPVYPLFGRLGGYILPSLPLETVRRSLGIPREQVHFIEGGGVLLGSNRVVPLNVRAEYLPAFTKGGNSVKVVSAHDLLSGRIGLESLRGRIVFLGDGRSDARLGTAPQASRLSTVEVSAVVASNLLNQAGYVQPAWERRLAEFLAAAFFIGVLAAAFLAPRPLVGLLALGLALLYPLLSFLAFRTTHWWLPPELPFLAALTAWLPSMLLARGKTAPTSPPAETYSAAVYDKQSVVRESDAPVFKPIRKPEATAPAPKTRPAEYSVEPGDDRPQIIRDETGQVVQLGKYQLIRKIASGGGGSVYEGLDTSMGRKVAIKTLLNDADLRFSRMHDRFTNEARAAGSLSHPYINTVYDFGRIKNVTYLVLEFLEGRTLAEWMRENPIPDPAFLMPWLEQICDALDYAHSRQIIHRDLKPGNLKLLDFGIAKVEDMMLTQTGVAVGTPVYMSPEQFTGEKVGPASDQYGLSVVIYQILSHKLPYVGTRIPEICNRIVKNEIIPLIEQNPRISPWIWDALKKGLSLKSTDRYENCTGLYTALKASL